MNAAPLLSVRDLAIAATDRGANRSIATGIDLDLARGESIAIVGESGSGKTLTARAVARLLPRGVVASGAVRFDGVDIMALTERELRSVRGRRLAMLFQDPFAMLNPLMRVGEIVRESLPARGSRAEVRRRLAEVGIEGEDVLHRLPFQLSGGMCQRVALAAALARDPELLIADEPSTALDASTQAEIVALLKRLQAERGMGMILVTHDLRLAFSACRRVYVLYAGALLEVGDAPHLESDPYHPYTLGLLLAEPPLDRRLPHLTAIPGSVPRPDAVANRCAFADRCTWAADPCRAGRPPLVEVEPRRRSACIRLHEIRPDMRALRHRALDPGPGPVRSRRPERPLVAVRALGKTFVARGGRTVQALTGVSLEIFPAESVGLIGQSGSGKTTLGRCLIGLEPLSEGTIEIDGMATSDLATLSRVQRTQLRRLMQMVFQDPLSTLNPRHSVDRCLSEALRAGGVPKADFARRIEALLRDVGLPPAYADRLPVTLSGGERQRVAIARALAVRPRVLVCDEPVSSLDISVQAQILNLFRRLQKEHGLAYLFISHDPAVIRQVADRVYVLRHGKVVEHGPADEVLTNPRHPYTRALIQSGAGGATTYR